MRLWLGEEGKGRNENNERRQFKCEDSLGQGKSKAEAIHCFCPFSLYRFLENLGFSICSQPEKMDCSKTLGSRGKVKILQKKQSRWYLLMWLNTERLHRHGEVKAFPVIFFPLCQRAKRSGW